MFKTLRNAWRQPELKHKLLFTAFIIIIYRLCSAIPVPYFAFGGLSEYAKGTILEFFNILSGGAFTQGTLLALSVSPYITASIVMQLLTVAIPKLGEKAKQGEEGKKFINFWTRIVTIILAIVTAFGYALILFSQGATVFGTVSTAGFFKTFLPNYGMQFFTMVVCYCAGAAIVMWLAEKINDSGLGNGISIILFANIVAGVPSQIIQLYKTVLQKKNI